MYLKHAFLLHFLPQIAPQLPNYCGNWAIVCALGEVRSQKIHLGTVYAFPADYKFHQKVVQIPATSEDAPVAQ